MPSDTLSIGADSTLEQVLDELAGLVDGQSQAGQVSGDAIDRELNRPPRTTAVQSVRRHPAMQAFRRERIDAAVRLDTLRQVLSLAQTLIGLLTAR
jgi:hypothetical protein